MELLNKLRETKQEILKYFGASEGYGGYPIENHCNDYWYLSSDSINWSEKDCKMLKEGDPQYAEELYGQEPVFKGKDYTMVLVRDCCGHGEYLAVFDNSKERKPDE